MHWPTKRQKPEPPPAYKAQLDAPVRNSVPTYSLHPKESWKGHGVSAC